MTFSAIYSRIQAQLTDVNPTQLGNIKNYINDGQQDFAQRSDSWSWLLASSTKATVAGTQTYSLDSDVHKVINVRDETNNLYLKEMNRKQFELAFPYVNTTNDRNNPTIWFPFGVDTSNNLQIKLYPVPSAVVTIRYDYYKRMTDLAADADVSVIPARYHKALVYYACARYFEQKQDPMATYYDGKYEQEIQKALGDQFNETDGLASIIPERKIQYNGREYSDNYFINL